MGDSSETRAIQTTRDIVQFIDANGVFAGAALDGAVIAPDPRRPGRCRAGHDEHVTRGQRVVDGGAGWCDRRRWRIP